MVRVNINDHPINHCGSSLEREEEILANQVMDQVMFKEIMLAKMDELIKCKEEGCYYFACCSDNMLLHQKAQGHRNLRTSHRLTSLDKLTGEQCCGQTVKKQEFWSIQVTTQPNTSKERVPVCFFFFLGLRNHIFFFFFWFLNRCKFRKNLEKW